MSKSKHQTIQMRFGFKDEDLKKPKHDDIILWLDQQVESFLPTWLSVSPGHWQESEIHINTKGMSFYDVDPSLIPKKPPVQIERKIWEYPVCSEGYKNKYIVGFADMYIHYRRPVLSINKDYNNVSVDSYLIGEDVFFEVKVEIPSLGELVRQIRMYQAYTQGKWIVVSPEDKFESALASQNILFVHYPINEIEF